jgi:hypothetical protein
MIIIKKYYRLVYNNYLEKKEMMNRLNNNYVLTDIYNDYKSSSSGVSRNVQILRGEQPLETIEEEKEDNELLKQSGKGLEDIDNINAPDIPVNSGSNMLGVIGAALQILKEGAQLTYNAYSGQTATYVKNVASKVFDKNPESRPGFVGEKHMVLPTKYGLSMANFAGPGTNLSERLSRGDTGVDGPNGIDIAAKQHDIDYSNATSLQDIHKADKAFIKKVHKSSAPSWARKFVKKAIKAKMFAEKTGFIHPSSYTNVDLESKRMEKELEKKLRDAEPIEDQSIQPVEMNIIQKGEGVTRIPGQKLKNKLLRLYSKKLKQKKQNKK